MAVWLHLAPQDRSDAGGMAGLEGLGIRAGLRGFLLDDRLRRQRLRCGDAQRDVPIGRDGAVRWQRTYGGELWDWPGQVAVRPDGGLLMAGYTTSLGAGYEDVWVLRLDAEGRL